MNRPGGETKNDGIIPSVSVKEWVGTKTTCPPPAPPAALLEPHTGVPPVGSEILGGKYTVERVIGVGGMGVVVSALHKQLGRQVAIKFLSGPMQTPDLVDRFIREGQAAVRIKSEHIASVLDVGVLENGTPYLMMEYLSGADLADYLAERGAVPVTDAVDFILQTCDALAVAHSAGIIHRDLKPSNLFVTQRSDGSPLLKVLDFGISKITQSLGPNPKATLTRPGMMLGSPRYMSPEQLRNASSVDHRADIWALGVVLHELVAGTPPYDADTFVELCAKIAQEAPPRLREAKPDAPEAVEQIILKCIEKDPAHRWDNVAELAQALAPLAPEESRFIAARAWKILRQEPKPTGPGSYRSTAVSPGATPKPIERTLPLMPASGGGGSGAEAGARSSQPSPEPISNASSQPSPLAVSNARPAAPPSPARRIGGVAAGIVVVALVAIAALRGGKPAPAPAASAPPEATSSPIRSAEPPRPSSAPVETASAEASASAEPPAPSLAPTVRSPAMPPRRPAPHTPTAPSGATSAAPKPGEPSEIDMLNRRR